MRVPEHLSHKPIIAVDNYHKMDGIHKDEGEGKEEKDKQGTDAKGLSIGRSQWKKEEISAKVWRHKKETGWSRQSEELPLHRVLDLAILILSVYNSPEKYTSSGKKGTMLGEIVVDERGLEDIKNFFEEKEAEDADVFKKRIQELKRLLEV